MSNNNIPERKDVPSSDKWDLTTLFKSDDDWEKALAEILPDAELLKPTKENLDNLRKPSLKPLNYMKNCGKMQNLSAITQVCRKLPTKVTALLLTGKAELPWHVLRQVQN